MTLAIALFKCYYLSKALIFKYLCFHLCWYDWYSKIKCFFKYTPESRNPPGCFEMWGKLPSPLECLLWVGCGAKQNRLLSQLKSGSRSEVQDWLLVLLRSYTQPGQPHSDHLLLGPEEGPTERMRCPAPPGSSGEQKAGQWRHLKRCSRDATSAGYWGDQQLEKTRGRWQLEPEGEEYILRTSTMS